MTKVNALTLRQSLGKVLKQLEKGGAPIFIERQHQTVAVLVSMRDFSERFADKYALAEREQLVQEIHAFRKRQRPADKDALTLLQELRDSR